MVEMVAHNCGKTLPVAAGCVVVLGALSVGLGMIAVRPSAAQSAGIKIPEFEVVSIRENKSNGAIFGLQRTANGLLATNEPLLIIIRTAYGIMGEPARLVGVPDWVKSARYDIQAKVADSDVAVLSKLSNDDPIGLRSVDQRGLMLEALLANRFKLKVHSEDRELPVYALVLAKSGSKLKVAKPGEVYAGGRAGTLIRSGGGQIIGQGVSIADLAKMFSGMGGVFDRPVMDKTGLTATYDFILNWTPDPDKGTAQSSRPPGNAAGNDVAADPNGASIFTAVQEQLGLKLEPTKGPVKFYVVDHIERPSAN